MAAASYFVGNFESAAKLFLASYLDNESSGSALNLIQMARRNEIPKDFEMPHLAELFQTADLNDIYIVNEALCLAQGFGFPLDWKGADEKIKSLLKLDDLGGLDWFDQRASLNDDTEAHLVLGWLTRHDIREDPEGLSAKDRFDKARKGGVQVPLWMDE